MRTRLISLFCLLFAASIFHAPPVSAQTAGGTLVIDADRQFAFAEQLFSRQDYLSAANEYRRFVFFFPQDPRRQNAMMRIGDAYFKSGDFPKAVEAYKGVIETYEAPTPEAYFMLSESFAKMRAYAEAVAVLQRLASTTDSNVVKDRARYRIGWMYIENEKWKAARQAFDRMSPDSKSRYDIPSLLEGLEKHDRIPHKSPATAGILSIVPGAGHLYTGRTREALLAFLLNVGVGYAAYEAFDNDSPGLGALLSFVELGFYSGTIYSAANSARKYNDRQKEQFIRNLAGRHGISLSLAPNAAGVMISYRFRF